ncbi:MAG: FumA C-terminus/TtdB family hydratase beta subunit [Bacillota bacterium]|nr:FumA C-terminus/TtdB family hydratase beta subunit [Bacillota bacterium]
MEEIRVNLQDLRKELDRLEAGQTVLLSGTAYTARDAAHKRIMRLLDEEKPLPFDIKDAVIYYAGPTPKRNEQVIGACGPTTSGRMDVYTPRLIKAGLCGMIGKGERRKSVIDSMVLFGAVYFAAVGGAGAVCAQAIKAQEVIAFPELGCESVKRLTLYEFPAIVAIDSRGRNLFAEGRKIYAE